MNATDKPAFAACIVGCLQEVYEKSVTANTLSVWFAALQAYPLKAVQAAIQGHITDPERGRFAPKPADIIGRITQAADEADTRPGPDEAWGVLIRVIRDERETGILSDEMRGGWAACQPILDIGDEVGARRCFLETYARLVAEAKRSGIPARWSPTLGTDPALRHHRLREAIEAQRLTADHAMTLLPALTPPSEPVAGLLSGPHSQAQAETLRHSFRELAAQLKGTTPRQESQQAEQARERRERMDALGKILKAQIQAMMDERARLAEQDAQAVQTVKATEAMEDADNANFPRKLPDNENRHAGRSYAA